MNKISAPAWSIQGKCKFVRKVDHNTSTQQSPSPNAYKIHEDNATPTWKFGSEQRCKQKINANPGIGTYNVAYDVKSKKYGKIGKNSSNRKLQTSYVPGPTYYSPVVVSLNYGIKFSKDKKLKHPISDIPGPGAYNQKQNNLRNVCTTYSIGKQNRFLNDDSVNLSPGPGSYTPKRPSSAGGKCSFGKQVKLIADSTHKGQPGRKNSNNLAGQYSYLNLFQQGVSYHKGYSLGVRPKSKREEDNPGPGAYNTHNIQRQSSPSFTMAHKYKQVSPTCTPGPGQYNTCAQINKNISMSLSKAKRSFYNLNKNMPGPGAYDTNKSQANGPKYSLGQSRKVQHIDNKPGPGAYTANTNYIKQRPKSAKIGRQKRGYQNKQNFPGPGCYEISKTDKSHKYSFTKSSQLHKTSISPGPSDYNIASTIANIPSYIRR